MKNILAADIGGTNSRFTHSRTMQATLEQIPVFLNTNEESGLWGAGFSAAQVLRHDN